MTTRETTIDQRLVARVRDGDKSAVADLYDRYADRIYSYHLIMVGDPNVAAIATNDTFGEAISRMGQLEDASHLRPWLLALARSKAYSTGRIYHRPPSEDQRGVIDAETMLGPEADEPDLSVVAKDLAQGFGDRDRELLALHLVEGLEGDELANVMGMPDSQLDPLVSHMRERVDATLGVLLVAKLGGKDCAELSALVDDPHEGRPPSSAFEHIESCDRCTERRTALLAPANALPGLLLTPAPSELRTLFLTAAGVTKAAPVPSGRAPEWARIALVAVIALVLVGLGSVIVGNLGDEEPVLQAADTTIAGSDPVVTVAPTTVAETPSEDTSTPTTATTQALRGQIEVASAELDLGDERTQATLELLNSGEGPASWSIGALAEVLGIDANEGELAAGETVELVVSLDRDNVEEGEFSSTFDVVWDDGTITISVAAVHQANPIIHNPRAAPSPIQANAGSDCSPTTTVITARIRDASELERVFVRWTDGSGSTDTPMSPTGEEDTYEARIGPFPNEGSFEARVLAYDVHENGGGASITITVEPCA